MFHFLLFSLSLWAGPSVYLKNLPLPASSKSKSIVFGTPSIGYFESSQVTQKEGHLVLRHIPPSYLEPIEYYETIDGLRCVLRRKFSNPTTKEHSLRTFAQKGSITPPFFLTNGYTPFEPADKMTPMGHSVVFILNRLGETVWSYLPDKVGPSSDHRTRTTLAKMLNNNEVGLLRSYDRSYFEKVNADGVADISLSPLPTEFHHDFILDQDNALITFSNAYKSLRKPWFFWRAPILFLSSPLIKFSFESRTATRLWDYLDDHSPFHESGWTWNAVDSTPNHSNFTHGNSIEQNNEGYLVSFRNINKAVFVNSKTMRIDWMLDGNDLGFYRQHHATFKKHGEIMLFDNGKTESRILIFAPPQKGKKAVLLKDFRPSPPVHSSRHGSAVPFSGEKIIGFFPNTTPGSREPNRIIEFDESTSKEVGRLEYHFGYDAAGYRAQPLPALFRTRPFHGKVPRCQIR